MNLYPISTGFTAATSFVLGIFVILKNPKSIINRTWGLGCLACSGWALFFMISLLVKSKETADITTRILILFSAWIAPLCAHFAKELSGINLHKKNLIRLGYATPVVLVFFIFSKSFCEARIVPGIGYYPICTGWIFLIYAVHFFFYSLYCEVLLIKGLMVQKDVFRKNQIRYVLLGLSAGFFGGWYTFLPTFGFVVPLFPIHFVWVYAVFISYAILKHRLMDIEVVIKRTVFYSLFVIMLSLIYVGVIFETHHLLMERTPFSLGNIYPVSISFTSAFSFILGFFVILRNPRRKLNLTWGIACLCVGSWALCFASIFFVTSQEWADFLARQMNIYASYIPVLIAHFCLEVAEDSRKWLKRIVIFGYFLCVIFTVFGTTAFFGWARPIMGFRYYTQAGPLFVVFTAQFAFYSVLGLYILLKNFKRHSFERQNQMKYILLGLFIGYVTGAIAFLPVYNIKAEPVLLNFVWLYAAIISYAILKHQLLDIRIVIKKTLSYSAMGILVSAVYFSAVLIFYFLFIDKRQNASYVASFAGVIFIALTFKPVEMFLHRILERKFFKGTIGEISEQKSRLETELERGERLKSVGILAAGMAHEIKNPITAIQTFAEYLPKKYDDPQFRETFTRLVTLETRRISEIVRDLLLFARPSEPNPEVCDVAKIVKSVLDLLSAEFTKNSIEIEFVISLEDSQCIIDPSQIKQAILNILMNAIDAVKDKESPRKISVLVGPNEHHWIEIAIRDTGVGIAPERIPHLFDPFYTDKEGRTGLGLAITHSIVEKNGGKIEVESVVNCGTAFKIFLPYAH